MRIDQNVTALSMQEMLFKSRSSDNSLVNKKFSDLKVVKNEQDTIELAVMEKMKSQMRDLNNAVKNSNDEILFEEAATSMQSITSTLREMQEIMQTIQDKIFNNEKFEDLDERAIELWQTYKNLSNKEIFNSEMFKDSLQFTKKDITNFDIEEIKELADLYQNKIEELAKINKEFKEKSGGSITEVNLGAAESHIQNVTTAEEIVSKTKDTIINDAKVAILSQANKRPEKIINLLE